MHLRTQDGEVHRGLTIKGTHHSRNARARAFVHGCRVKHRLVLLQPEPFVVIAESKACVVCVCVCVFIIRFPLACNTLLYTYWATHTLAQLRRARALSRSTSKEVS